ncbi:HPr family phosphocarrier protein [Actinotalea sp. M2MS4P-6]|nr:HPr family phosphocarrier protein [Actinotalea sp. M2MS4P-6]
MLSRTVTVGAASGLHARPAALFTKAAAQCGHQVLIGPAGGPSVDASSILMVMGLGVRQGQQVELSTADEAGAGALDELAAMLASDLDAVG